MNHQNLVIMNVLFADKMLPTIKKLVKTYFYNFEDSYLYNKFEIHS